MMFFELSEASHAPDTSTASWISNFQPDLVHLETVLLIFKPSHLPRLTWRGKSESNLASLRMWLGRILAMKM